MTHRIVFKEETGIWHVNVMTKKTLYQKVLRYWKKLRFAPIRVFCFHQVSCEFDPDTMWECDWTQADLFKRNIFALKKKYTFISLTKVTSHLTQDRFRWKHYAALTADDGWASVKNIVPWLVEQKIPITLFLNPLYMDGIHRQERETEKLLTKEEVAEMVEQYAPYISIASHGWSHEDCLKMSLDGFRDEVMKAESTLSGLKGKVPYYAFTYGRHNKDQMDILKNLSLVPVFMDGESNFADFECVHRELLDGKQF